MDSINAMTGKRNCQLNPDVLSGMNGSSVKKGRFFIGSKNITADCYQNNFTFFPGFTNRFNPDVLRVLLSQCNKEINSILV